MKKNLMAAPSFVKLACSVAIAGFVSLPLNAQTLGQSSEPPTPQQAPSASNQENNGERGLPSITNSANDPRAAQSQQQMQARSAQRTRQQQAGKLGRNGEDVKDAFADYVEGVTGARLELFGKELFRDVPSTFAPFDSAQVNSEYIIGTGDEIQIRGWGMVNVDVTATVDRNGAVYIPKVGAVKVAGIKYRDLQGHLKQAIGKIFSNFEITASISQTRALQIYVVGHAVQPGTYTLNSMSTLLNALFTSGGPAPSGSMRNVQLKRNGMTVATFDLYDMLVRGDKSHDANLRDGDVIYIPEVGSLVALTGNIKTPALFELKGKTSMAELLEWAGGVDSSSDQKRIIVEKTVDNAYQTLADLVAEKVAISSQLSAIPVQPADVVRVFAPSAVAVQARIKNEYVRVSGEVKQTGVFQIQNGETLRELIARLGGNSDAGYIFATQFRRESVRRTQQTKLNEIADRFDREFQSASRSRLAGTTDKDAVAIQAAEIERQRNVAEKLRAIKAEGRIVLELVDGNAQVKNLPDLPLQDGDSIYIPRKPGTVEVLGSVFQPNSFIYKPKRSVKDYVLLAGGDTASADTSEMYVIRADGTAQSGRNQGWFGGVGEVVINPGDTVVVPEKIERSSWRQSLKEWTAIFYQFGLGAAGLKVLKD